MTIAVYGDPAGRAALEQARERAADDWLRQRLSEAIEQLENPGTPEPVKPFDIRAYYPEENLPPFERLPVEDLIALLASSEAKWRGGAAYELGWRQEAAWLAERRLHELAREDPVPEVRGACWEALVRLGRLADYREEMLARLREASRPLAERLPILRALAGQEDDPLVRSMILELYDRQETRALAMDAMRQSGNPGFARYMLEHLDDPDPAVQREAILGVGTFGLRAHMHRLRKHFHSPLRAEALAAYAALAPMELSHPGMRHTLRKIEEAAGGLSDEEGELVRGILEERLTELGRHPRNPLPLFRKVDEDGGFEEDLPEPSGPKAGRNDPCPCGSGKKDKKCCGA
ncbi:MAG: SEC-C metal-binding domain-containing protein, partial [Bryobacteraceae bacterium]